MICIYNPDDITKATLKNYENILGSYEAAYYVLSLNNGYSLELTPEGKPSILYEEIRRNSGTDAEAIKQKALVYTSTFLKKYGDWTTDVSSVDPSILDSNGEPKYSFLYGVRDKLLESIMNNLFLSDGEFNTETRELSSIEPIDENSSYAISQILLLSLSEYRNEVLLEFLKSNPNATEYQKNLQLIRALRKWYDTKSRAILNEQKKSLASAFGLKYVQRPNGQVELVSDKEQSGLKNLRIKFVQNIDNDLLENQLLDISGTSLDKMYSEKIEGSKNYIHDGLVSRRRFDRMVSANTLIYVSLQKASAVTLSKTLAYHYISMMIDNDMIQLALKSFDDTGNRSTLYLVNKLVDAITEPMTRDKDGISLIDKALSLNLSEDQQKKLLFFGEFWSNFDKLKDDIINKGVNTEDAKNKILSVVAASIALNEQHSGYMNQGTHFNYTLGAIDEVLNMYSTKYNPDILQIRKKIDSELKFFNVLKTSYENRVERLRRRNDPDSTQSKLLKTLINLQNLNQSDIEKELDQKNIIKSLLDLADAEITDAYNELYRLELDSAATVLEKSKFIMNAYNETVSYYNTLIGSLLDPLFYRNDNKYESLNKNRVRVLGMIRDLQNSYNNILLKTTSEIIDLWVDSYTKDGLVSTKDKINMKANYKKWLINQSLYGDISIYEPWITMNSNSRSGVIRIALRIILNANAARELELDEACAELGNLLEKVQKNLIKKGNVYAIGSTILPGVNFLELFLEHDVDGKTTGYFSRKFNFGQFYLLRNSKIIEIVNRLNEEVRSETGNLHFEFELDNFGQPIFPEDSIYEKYWREYNIAINDFDCKYGNKQFKKEYYELRFNNLSRKTILMQDDLQEKINALLGPVTENGIPHVERLHPSDRSALYELRKQLDNLSNEWDITTKEKKQGDELKVAQELKAFRELIKDKVLYEERYVDDGSGNTISLYNYTLNNIPDSQKDIFEKNMSTKEINPLFWDVYDTLKQKYMSQFPSSFDTIFLQIKELTNEKFDIINTVKDRGYKLPNLEDLSDNQWSRLKEIDLLILDLYKPIQDFLKNLSTKITSAAAQIAEFPDIPGKKDSRSTLFSEFITDAINQDQIESQNTGITTHRHLIEAQKKYTIEVHFVDEHGYNRVINRPLSVFKYLKPSITDEQLIKFGINPSEFLPIITKPNAEFNTVVKPSDPRYKADSYVNEDFDTEYDAFIQPKFISEQFKTIEQDKDLYQLYSKLIEYMQKANENIPAIKSSSKYRLPQMRADSSGILGRRLSLNFINAPKLIFNNIGFVLNSEFSINENDDDVNDDFTTMPDGSRVNSLPVRFVQMLKHPEYITRDVVNSVIQYYSMALNYKYKAEIEPLLISLLNQVSQTQTVVNDNLSNASHLVIHGQNTNQYAKLKDIVDSELYGQDKYFKESRGSSKLTSNQKRNIKISKHLRKTGILAALARNTFSQSTGFLDALVESAVFSSTGDAFNQEDYAEAIALLGGNSGRALQNIGKMVASGKVVALMRKNGLSKDPMRFLKDSHHSRLRRTAAVVTNPMAGFRIADYTVDAITMTAMYLNTRYSEKYNLFLSKNDFIGRLIHDGYSQQEAETIYKKSKKLYFCYEEKNGVAELNDDIKAKMSQEDIKLLEYDMRTSLKTWVPKFNGAVSDEDKAMLLKNIYGSFITALRTYLINKSQTLLVTGDDFQSEQESKRELLALQSRYKNLYAVRKAIKNKTSRQKKIDELNNKISETEQEMVDIMNGKVDKILVNKELLKPAAINTAATGLATYLIGSLAYAINPTFGTIVYGAGSLATLWSSGYVYMNTKKLGTAESSITINRYTQLDNKLTSLKKQLQDTLNSGDIDDIDSLLYNISKEIEELKSKIRNSKGFYDFSRNIIANGHLRCWFDALQSALLKANWYMSVMFRPNYKATHYKPFASKMSKQMTAGIRRINTQLVVLCILWVTAMFNLCAYRDNNMEDFLPSKIPVVGKYIKSGAEYVLNKENAALIYAADKITNSDAWNYFWDLVHDSSTKGVVSAIPLVNHYAEAIADDMLGYKKTVRRSNGEVIRKPTDKVLSRVDAVKSVLALLSIRLFAELFTGYDPNTINDLLSSVSSPGNVDFKMFDTTLNFAQASIDGSLNNYVQRASWQGYFTKSEYLISNMLAPAGVPQAWKSWKKAGRDASMQYRLNIGIMPTLFPKPLSLKNTQIEKIKSSIFKPRQKSPINL